ncbi:MAG: 3-oxoacyl-ACP reductase [Candidatus Eremiobacteraeota bacterium]|nr:3-oxoacyl-ACP reductase [Candidatus Eremiobacteraeota bacterium]
MNELDLRGRVAAVTGGASGIGFAIARRITGSGARVSLWDVDEAALRKASSALGDAHRAAFDVRDYASVEAARDATLAAMGRIDVLVNSAGITGPNATTWEYPLDSWRATLEVNLTGTFHTCRAVVPAMREHGYGRIVNVASVAGKEGNPNAAAYSASKAGVIALTKSLGKELAGTAICVNCVTPAAVETPLFAQMTQGHIDYMKSKIPMGRFGTVDEIAALVAWLCTEECSFTTGAVFDLSGGRSTY